MVEGEGRRGGRVREDVSLYDEDLLGVRGDGGRGEHACDGTPNDEDTVYMRMLHVLRGKNVLLQRNTTAATQQQQHTATRLYNLGSEATAHTGTNNKDERSEQ